MDKPCSGCCGGCETTVRKVVEITPHPIPGAVGDECASAEPKHCGLCGDTHAGPCSPGAFDYFICSNCNTTQRLPGDVLVVCGLGGIFCCCDSKAEDSWEKVSYEQYQEAERENPSV